MEIKFSKEEVEAIILAHAKTYCYQLNTVSMDTGYSYLRQAIVSYVGEKVKSEPIAPLPDFEVVPHFPTTCI